MTGLLDGHIAVVTGGGSGIGRAIAQGYAREGAQVAVLDVNGDAAAETVKAITGAGGKALELQAGRDRARQVPRGGRADRRARSATSRSWSTMPASTAATPSPPTPTR